VLKYLPRYGNFPERPLCSYVEFSRSLNRGDFYEKITSYSQIMAILKHAGAGTPVPGLWCEHSMSNASFYQWRSRFGGIQAYAVSGFLVVDTDFII